MDWGIWIFLITWLVIAVILFHTKVSGIVSVGGSFLIALVFLMIFHTIIKPAPSLSPKQATAKQANAQINEKELLRNSFFGDFTKAKIEKKKGTKNLHVWKSHIIYSKTLPTAMQSVMLEGVEKLQVEYDEIWQVTEPQLDRLTLYWENNKIQASTLENYYEGDPSTQTKLPKPSYKLDNIYNRYYILNKLSE